MVSPTLSERSGSPAPREVLVYLPIDLPTQLYQLCTRTWGRIAQGIRALDHQTLPSHVLPSFPLSVSHHRGAATQAPVSETMGLSAQILLYLTAVGTKGGQEEWMDE